MCFSYKTGSYTENTPFTGEVPPLFHSLYLMYYILFTFNFHLTIACRQRNKEANTLVENDVYIIFKNVLTSFFRWWQAKIKCHDCIKSCQHMIDLNISVKWLL